MIMQGKASMPYITVDDDQARIIAGSRESVEIRDRAGRRLGYIVHGFTPAEITEAERRADSDGPWHSTQEVVKHLQSLES
jgi:hypothetical protein